MRGPTKTSRLVATLLLGAALALGGCSEQLGSAPAPTLHTGWTSLSRSVTNTADQGIFCQKPTR